MGALAGRIDFSVGMGLSAMRAVTDLAPSRASPLPQAACAAMPTLTTVEVWVGAGLPAIGSCQAPHAIGHVWSRKDSCSHRGMSCASLTDQHYGPRQSLSLKNERLLIIRGAITTLSSSCAARANDLWERACPRWPPIRHRLSHGQARFPTSCPKPPITPIIAIAQGVRHASLRHFSALKSWRTLSNRSWRRWRCSGELSWSRSTIRLRAWVSVCSKA